MWLPCRKTLKVVQLAISSYAQTPQLARITAQACKGRSKKEFIAKLGIVEEEADELVAIMAASRITASKGIKK